MKSAAQIVGVLILIGSIGAWSEFFERHPSFDPLADPAASGEFLGMLFMSVVAIGLVVYGLQKGPKKKTQKPEKGGEPNNQPAGT